MLTGVHETLRSAGRELRLEATGDPQLEARVEELAQRGRSARERRAAIGQALRDCSILRRAPSSCST